jgi:RNA recognition motif-containing protein
MYLYLIEKDRRYVFFRTEISEEEIRNIFSEYGTIKRFKFFEKDRKMALIEMDTIEQTIAALIVRI